MSEKNTLVNNVIDLKRKNKMKKGEKMEDELVCMINRIMFHCSVR